jgi:xylulokinase
VWRQILADVTGMSHATVNVDEGPAFGAALLAAVGAGAYNSVPEACKSTIRESESTAPDAAKAEVYSKYYAVYRSLYPALAEPFRHIHKVALSFGAPALSSFPTNRRPKKQPSLRAGPDL